MFKVNIEDTSSGQTQCCGLPCMLLCLMRPLQVRGWFPFLFLTHQHPYVGWNLCLVTGENIDSVVSCILASSYLYIRKLAVLCAMIKSSENSF